MKQDLLDWLNTIHTENVNNSGGAEDISLLLAPVGDSLPAPEDTFTSQTQDITEPSQEQITALNDAWQVTQQQDSQQDIQVDNYELPQIDSTLLQQEDNNEEDTDSIPQEISADNITQEDTSTDAQEIPGEEHSSLLNEAWHRAANLNINLDEPPAQMWTDIDSEEDDDDPKDYEETSSLQGDAYIPVIKHGANFTARLQATLKTRKDRAARAREKAAEDSHDHTYVQKAVIFCGVLLMALGFAYLGLYFIQRETPEGLNSRAMTAYENGNFDEAADLYARGCRRYPHVLTFFRGLAQSAEKAGRTQTAITAWNEYMSSLPEEDTASRASAQQELDRLIPGGETKEQTYTVTVPQQTKPAETQTPSRTRPQLPDVRPITFEEALSEGRNAFNIGMFSRAITHFHKAHNIRENDIRPYVGLIASYRAKGMFFDAKRLLDEARKKFGRRPELEIEMYYLRRE